MTAGAAVDANLNAFLTPAAFFFGHILAARSIALAYNFRPDAHNGMGDSHVRFLVSPAPSSKMSGIWPSVPAWTPPPSDPILGQ